MNRKHTISNNLFFCLNLMFFINILAYGNLKFFLFGQPWRFTPLDPTHNRRCLFYIFDNYISRIWGEVYCQPHFPVLTFYSTEKNFCCPTAQKMKISIKDFFSKCDQIRKCDQIFCAVSFG